MKEFNDIYKQYYKAVYRMANRFLNSHENASDITQEVFVYLYKQIRKNGKIENEKAWLFKVTCNLSLAYIKKNKRVVELKNEKEIEIETESHAHSEIYSALQRLKENDKMLLTLYNEGLSYKELSEVTRIKFTSLGKTLSRALKRLKDEVEKRK